MTPGSELELGSPRTEPRSRSSGFDVVVNGHVVSPRPPAPGPGVPVGVRLGLGLALIVVAVLGPLAIIQHGHQLKRERVAREQLLAEALAPVAAAIETASNMDEVQARLDAFAEAFNRRGLPPRQIVLRDHQGRPVATSGIRPSGAQSPLLHVVIPVTSILRDGASGAIELWQAEPELAAEGQSWWRAWWLDILAACVAIILTLTVALHLLITRPLSRLLRGLARLEAGHLGPIDVGPGAWEIRWLAWRFHRLTLDLADGARRLVAAERRALTLTRSGGRPRLQLRQVGEAGVGGSALRPIESERVRRYLEAKCRMLETLDPEDPMVRAAAEEAWSRDVVEAERISALTLKTRLDNAAFKILQPEAHERLGAEVERLVQSRKGWPLDVASRLRAALAEHEVPVVSLQHRIKNLAGVWRKLEERGLDLEELHDLFAFRLVVPEEEDCYVALHAAHALFEPEPFRFKDYIAQPKANGYRGLHTSVRDRDGALFELQIRSVEMHRAAESGQAAHWRYRAAHTRWRELPVQRAGSRWGRWLRR